MSRPSVTMTVIGEANLLKLLREIPGAIDESLLTALRAGGMLLQNKWKEAITDFGPHGATGKIGLIETGQYRQSVHILEAQHDGGTRYHVSVGTDIVDPPYPEILEFGSNDGKQAAYPHVRPMWDSNVDSAEGEVADVLKGCLRRYGA